MTDMTQYQVVAECCYATFTSGFGESQIRLLNKGAMFPADDPKLKVYLADGFVAKVGGDETGGVDAAGIPAAAYDADVPEGMTTTPVEKSEEQRQADAEASEQVKAAAAVADKRTAAQAKLPEDGSAPDGRASKDVWVEYLAAKGYAYDELIKQDKSDLVELAK